MLSARFATIASSLQEPRATRLEDDLMAMKFIKKELLQGEVSLYKTKWFDYRHLSPFRATCLYIEAFGPIYRQFYARYFDRATAENIQPISLDRVLRGLEAEETKAKRRFAYLWRGRMAADMIGMPYELYLNCAFEYRLRFWNRRYMPQPQHLFDYLDLEKIALRWQELQETDNFVSEHPAYLIQNDVGAEHQRAHRIWVVNQALKRGDPIRALADYIEKDLLTAEDVETQRPELYQHVLEALD